MLSNFIIALEAVLPMFILMAVGVAVKEKKLMEPPEIKKMNHMVFVVFFPAMMFHSLYGKDLAEALNGKLLAFGVASVLVIYVASMAAAFAATKNSKSRGAMIQGLYRSNFVIMGLPIAANLLGRDNLGVTAMMVAVIVPMYNVMAVITLEVFRGGKPSFRETVKKVVTNPLILGAAAGLITVVFRMKLPEVLEEVVSDMAAVTTPLALIILGASIDFKEMGSSGKNLFVCVLGRLVVIPAIGLWAAAFCGFRGIEFVTLLAMFASPAAVSSFTMAQSMESDVQLAGGIVIFTTAFASFTMFLWIFLFKNLGMF